jgi:hypothetical protein
MQRAGLFLVLLDGWGRMVGDRCDVAVIAQKVWLINGAAWDQLC